MRLRNKVTGVVVDVDDATATRLPAVYESLDAPKPRRAPRNRK